MSSGRRFSRRKHLKKLGGVGSFVGVASTSVSPTPEFSIELDITHELAEMSQRECLQRDYISRIVEHWVDESIRPLLSDKYRVGVYYNGLEPDVSSDRVEALKEYKDLSDSGNNCSLLITDHEFGARGGTAETVDYILEESVAVVGEGSDFLEIGRYEWHDKVLVKESERFHWEHRYDPWKTVVPALHEIGHAMGLEHEDGEIYRVDGGLAASVMKASQMDRFTMEEELKPEDNLYYSTQYSDKAKMKFML